MHTIKIFKIFNLFTDLYTFCQEGGREGGREGIGSYTYWGEEKVSPGMVCMGRHCRRG